ncbi:DNA ligase 3-like [Lytechinus variegatus]|uniref:DNA ligase 3-like n=1 Tax=Lytechinus variegatus TaxID=7654 RepID=UPI001BB28FC3|nr:DNA ligase 3-like [Lytechinus variegatus]
MRSKVYAVFHLGWTALKGASVRHGQQHLVRHTSASFTVDLQLVYDTCSYRQLDFPKSYPSGTLSFKFIREAERILGLLGSSSRPSTLLSKTASGMDDEKAFMVDYARLGTSKCKRCKQGIEKKSPRIAKLTANPFSDDGGMMKNYFHINCMFETFVRARATTKKIEDPSDLDGFEKMEDEEKKLIRKNIEELLSRVKTPKKTPTKKKGTVQGVLTTGGQVVSPSKHPKPSTSQPASSHHTSSTSAAASSSATPSPTPSKTSYQGDGSDPQHPDNSFREYRKLCANIADQAGHHAKTKVVAGFLKSGSDGQSFQGDTYLVLKLLLPGVVKRVYNINSKQLVKLFSQIFGTDLDDMVTDLEQGDVSETVRKFFVESSHQPPIKKSVLTLYDVDKFLDSMTTVSKELDQQRELAKITRKCTANDLKMVVRLLKHDLRINSGAKHILDALDPNAYEAFQASRDLLDVVTRVLANQKASNGVPGMTKKLSVRAALMTPVLPMLAEACKSVEMGMRKCPNGMYAEIKYDGERVQIHKQGDNFQYFSRSLKPVLPHKVAHIKDWIPKACPHGNSLILDSEILMVDKDGKILPFGTLGIHKKSAFQDANVCLFVFDCLHFNGEDLMDKPLKTRRKILEENLDVIPNRIMLSESKYVTKSRQLSGLIADVIQEGLEGLVLKDVRSVYEPGKRHWLKVKKDYLKEGAMADSADLLVLGAFYGTGTKGGMMSIFLMGVYDPASESFRTVTKCANGLDDKTMDQVNRDLDMVKISKDSSKVPSWLRVNKTLVPDFVIKDPKKAPVWEIIGAEFTQSETHTAGGISIRFPRVTRFRDDKDFETATDLPRLRTLFKKSKESTDVSAILGVEALPSKVSAKRRKDDDDEDDDEEEITGFSFGKGGGTGASTSGKGASPTKRAADSPAKKVKTENSNNSNSPSPRKDNAECKYGAGCYQKSKEHQEKFRHTSSPSKHSPSKGLPNVFTGMVVYIPVEVKDNEKLQRYVIAYDGDVVDKASKSQATHVVRESKASENGTSSSAANVTSDWLWQCIRMKKLVPM